MPVAYSRGRRSGGYANWLTCQWHVNGSSEPLAKNSPTDDNADDCISGNYYGYERGGTLALRRNEAGEHGLAILALIHFFMLKYLQI